MLWSTWQALLFDDTTIASADTVLVQVAFMHKLMAQLEVAPEEVVEVFQELTSYSE